MKLGGVARLGMGLMAGAALAIATGCASTAGWGPAPANTGAPVTEQHGAPRFVQTTGMRRTAEHAEVTAPPWIRVQDCAIVAISTNSRYACPDGKVYTNFQLSRARTGEYVLPPLPPPAPIVVTPLPQVASAGTEKIILRGVHFDFNKSDIRPQDAAVLDEAAETLKSHSDVAVNVNGYCDSVGGARYNLGLSDRRSGSVVHYLSDHGVAEGRLSPRGYGKTDFVASNSTEEGRAQNRRVEMVPSSTGKVFLMGNPASR